MITALGRHLARLVFWSWNLVFLAFAVFGVLPELPHVLRFVAGDADPPWSVLAWVLLVLGSPVAAIAVALTSARGRPERLWELLFCVEAPLFLLGLARLVLMRGLNPLAAFACALLVVSAATSVWELVRGDARGPIDAGARLAGRTAAIAITAWFALWIAFFAVPLAWMLAMELFSLDWVRDVWRTFQHGSGRVVLLAMLAGPLFAFTATLLVGLPLALPALTVRGFARAFATAREKVGLAWAARVAIGVASTCVAIGATLATQPHETAFELLAKTPQDAAAREALREERGAIRRGLLDAYLASWRYVGETGRGDLVGDLYRETFHVERDTAVMIQAAHDAVASPLFYQGDSMRADHVRAAELYAAFFDEPIQRAERDLVLETIGSELRRDRLDATALDVDARRVHLRRHEASHRADGDLAEVELHEVLENTTESPQEVVYSFSLPGTAAVTGVWLGDTDDRSRAFPYVVAPRGAAQRVYEEQVVVRRDPALLEQVGPTQYRLRVFPIPARPADDDAPVPVMHVWMQYRVLARDAAFPLPTLLERRNVFWDSDTEVSFDGAAKGAEPWSRSSIGRANALVGAHEAMIAGRRVVMRRGDGGASFSLVRRRIAVVVDRSLSMEKHARAVEAQLRRLGDSDLADRNDVDVFLTSAAIRGEPAARLDDVPDSFRELTDCFGSLTIPEMLAQFRSLAAGTAYDVVLVLTDDGGEPASARGASAPAMEAALWIVHVDGPARAYADPVLDLLQRRDSGTSTDLLDALSRYATLSGSDPSVLNVEDGWVVEVRPGAVAAEDPGFAAIAARQWLRAHGRGAMGSVEAMDALHALAREHSVVSPLSSMLVLVDDTQRARLAQLAAERDRFERTAQANGAVLPGSNFEVTGVPEPHEWVLIAIATALLAWRTRERWWPVAMRLA